MQTMRSRLLVVVLLSLFTFQTYAASSAEPVPAGEGGATGFNACQIGELFARTELYFGRSSPNGPVTDAQWQWFLDDVITPRFPDGLTVLMGKGQFKNQSGVIEQEDSVLVILLYPFQDSRSHGRIERIREIYKKRFAQQSVLRVDSTECVSF